MEDSLRCKATFGRRRHLVEDNLLWEDKLWWKMTFSGRQHAVENNLLWKMTFGGRRPWVEDNLWWKMTLGGRQTLVEDDLQWKTTFGGRRPSVEDDLWWILACCLVLFGAFSKDIYLSKYLMALYLKLMNTRWPPWNLEA